MGLRCSLGDVEGLETHWRERRRIRNGRVLLLVRAAAQVQGDE